MLSCPKSYELYVTSEYSMDWHLQQPYAPKFGVLSARQSGETEHRGAITYADLTEAGPKLPVIKRVKNVDGEIVTTTIMQLQNLPSTLSL